MTQIWIINVINLFKIYLKKDEKEFVTKLQYLCT